MSSAKSLFKHYAANFHNRLCEITGLSIEPRLARELYMDLYVRSPTRGFGNFCALLEKQPDALRALCVVRLEWRILGQTLERYNLPNTASYPRSELAQILEAYLLSKEPTPISASGGKILALSREHPAHFDLMKRHFEDDDPQEYRRPAHEAPFYADQKLENGLTVAQYMRLVEIPIPNGPTGAHPINGWIDVEVTLQSGESFVVQAMVTSQVADDLGDYYEIPFRRSTYRSGALYASDLFVELSPNGEIVLALQGVCDATASDAQEVMLNNLEHHKHFPPERIQLFRQITTAQADEFDAIVDKHPANLDFLQDQAYELLHYPQYCRYFSEHNSNAPSNCKLLGDDRDMAFLSVQFATRLPEVDEWERFCETVDPKRNRLVERSHWLSFDDLSDLKQQNVFSE